MNNGFDPNNPWTQSYFPKVLAKSNFRKVEKLGQLRRKISDDLIKKGMTNEEKRVWDNNPNHLTLDEKSIRYWTNGYYETIQTAIRDDNIFELYKCMPLIDCMNSYIKNHPIKKSMITYRKSKLTGNQLKTFKNMVKGRIFRGGLFTATTLNSNMLLSWPGTCIIKFIFDENGCKNASNIETLSAFPIEKEVLISAYCAMEFVCFQSFTLPSDIGKKKEDLVKDELKQLKLCPFITLKVLDNAIVTGLEKIGILRHKFEETNVFEYYKSNILFHPNKYLADELAYSKTLTVFCNELKGKDKDKDDSNMIIKFIGICSESINDNIDFNAGVPVKMFWYLIFGRK